MPSPRRRQPMVLPVRLQYAIKLPLRALEQLQQLHKEQQLRDRGGDDDNYPKYGSSPFLVPDGGVLPLKDKDDVSSPVQPIRPPPRLPALPVSQTEAGGPFAFFWYRPQHPLAEIRY